VIKTGFSCKREGKTQRNICFSHRVNRA